MAQQWRKICRIENSNYSSQSCLSVMFPTLYASSKDATCPREHKLIYFKGIIKFYKFLKRDKILCTICKSELKDSTNTYSCFGDQYNVCSKCCEGFLEESMAK